MPSRSIPANNAWSVPNGPVGSLPRTKPFLKIPSSPSNGSICRHIVPSCQVVEYIIPCNSRRLLAISRYPRRAAISALGSDVLLTIVYLRAAYERRPDGSRSLRAA